MYLPMKCMKALRVRPLLGTSSFRDNICPMQRASYLRCCLFVVLFSDYPPLTSHTVSNLFQNRSPLRPQHRLGENCGVALFFGWRAGRSACANTAEHVRSAAPRCICDVQSSSLLFFGRERYCRYFTRYLTVYREGIINTPINLGDRREITNVIA